MYCPLEEVELNTEVCPAKCMYRRADGSCAHNELAFNEELTMESIAEILGVEVEEVKREAGKGMRRVQAAIAAEAYIAYVCKGTVTIRDETQHPIFKLFNFSPSNLRKVLNEERYDKWKEISKVDIPFEDIESLFKSVT